MKRILATVLPTYVFALSAFTQPSGNYWSNLPCKVENKTDSEFIYSLYKRVRHNYLSNASNARSKITVWKGQQNFQSNYSADSAVLILKDSVSFDQNFRSWYDMCLLWNRNADTLNIVSFSPVSPYYKTGWWPSPTWGRIFDQRHRFVIDDFWSMLSQEEGRKFNSVLIYELSALLGSTAWNHPSSIRGDTLFKSDDFQCADNGSMYNYDTNGKLFQWLYDYLKDGIQKGRITGYVDSLCTKPLLNPSDERNWTYWDSTNFVENPDKPGEMMRAPIRSVATMTHFKVFEKWTPFNETRKDERYSSHLSYARHELAYGLGIHRTIWLNADDAKVFLSLGAFNFVPYQEVFKERRYQLMWISSEQY